MNEDLNPVYRLCVIGDSNPAYLYYYYTLFLWQNINSEFKRILRTCSITR